MDSARYHIQFGNINIGAANISSSEAKLSTTLGQLAANKFDSSGYIVKAGFQYIHSIIPFRFSISKTSIDFNTLIPDTPSEVVATFSAYFGAAGQYQITAAEEGTLQTLSSSSIVDTSCNGGGQTCNETTPAVWDSTSAHGFGYSMLVPGDDIPTSFTDCYNNNGSKQCYRPFPNLLAPTPETPAVVMSSVNVGKNRQAIIRFKANVSGTQESGSYQTIISFVATPTY